jgi:crotonobetainyl-CoA:carnitine CoA-transferase CaiB-like acyl-CoA transferase
MLLGDLGADVIKVEPPDGDATRSWGPPWVGDEAAGTRTAAYYLAVNRNKRSLRLDLRTEAGGEILRRLLQTADVFVENFRPESLARLGLGDEVLAELNSRLIHLAISGYGPTGPEVGRPGYDFLLQAEAGLMSITGAPDEAGGVPTKVGVAIADVAAGLHAAVGILAALAGRERNAGPAHAIGQRVDVSLLESTLSLLVNQAQNAFVTGRAPVRRGNTHPNIVPYQAFETADGHIVVTVGSERQWPRLCRALGLPALADDPRFATNGNRVTNREELSTTLQRRLGERTTAEWLEVLAVADVPAAPINDVPTAFATPQAQARRMTVEVEHPLLGRTTQVGLPFRLSATPAEIRAAPPLLGEHGPEILAELGYDETEIEVLRAGGAI